MAEQLEGLVILGRLCFNGIGGPVDFYKAFPCVSGPAVPCACTLSTALSIRRDLVSGEPGSLESLRCSGALQVSQLEQSYLLLALSHQLCSYWVIAALG